MNEVQTNRLYHYTSVNSLALILKNKTLRLNPLNQMDDLQETKSNSRQNYGQYVFVSSWTQTEEESIPMWKMYSSTTGGVRISLPRNPFKIYDETLNKFRDPTFAEWETACTVPSELPVINKWEYFPNEVCPTNYFLSDLLCEVKYSNDESKLNPFIEHISNEQFSLHVSKLGIYKSCIWEFQHECRYRLVFTPSFPISPGESDKAFATFYADLFHNNLICKIPYVDLSLAQNMLDQMVITTSPAISDANMIIVESLVSQLCPNARIEKSHLSGMIK